MLRAATTLRRPGLLERSHACDSASYDFGRFSRCSSSPHSCRSGCSLALLIARSSHEQRAIVERRNVETARAVSVAVDQHVESARAALQALAATEVLDAPDRATFNAVALRLVPTQPGWYAVLLVHPSGALIADTALGPTTIACVHHGGLGAQPCSRPSGPTVSNLFQDATTGGYFFVVAVPVVRTGEVRSVLAAQIRSTSLSEILRRQSAPPNGVISVLDGVSQIMARTRGEAEYIGKPPSRDFVAMLGAHERRKLALRRTLEGTPAYASLSRSPITGWTVGIGMPASEIDGPIFRSMWALGLVGALILGLGVAGALVLSSFIVRALTSAATAARALARGDAGDGAPSRIVEAEELSNGAASKPRAFSTRASASATRRCTPSVLRAPRARRMKRGSPSRCEASATRSSPPTRRVTSRC